jgi:hypothetical protein
MRSSTRSFVKYKLDPSAKFVVLNGARVTLPCKLSGIGKYVQLIPVPLIIVLATSAPVEVTD